MNQNKIDATQRSASRKLPRMGSRQRDLALFDALKKGGLTDVQNELRLGASPDACDEQGQSALGLCSVGVASGDCAALANALLDHGADPNLWIRTKRRRFNALHAAARALNAGVALALLEAGAHPNARDEKGRASLHALCESSANDQTRQEKQTELALILLNAGAGIDLLSSQRETPIAIALDSDNLALAAALARQGALLSSPNAKTTSALCQAAFNGQLGLCEIFMRLGADPHELSRFHNAFYYAKKGSIVDDTEKTLSALWEGILLERSSAPTIKTAPRARL